MSENQKRDRDFALFRGLKFQSPKNSLRSLIRASETQRPRDTEGQRLKVPGGEEDRLLTDDVITHPSVRRSR